MMQYERFQESIKKLKQNKKMERRTSEVKRAQGRRPAPGRSPGPIGQEGVQSQEEYALVDSCLQATSCSTCPALLSGFECRI